MSDLMMVTISFVILVSELIILLIFWSGIVQLRKSKMSTWFALFLLLFTLSFVINILVGRTKYELVVVIITSFFALRLFCNEKWYVLLFCAVTGIVFVNGIDNTMLYLIATIFKVEANYLIGNFHYFILITILCKIIGLVIALLFKKYAGRYLKKEDVHWRSWIQTLPLPIATCFLMVTSISISQYSQQAAPMLVFINIAFLAICTLQIFIAKKLDKQKQNEAECLQLGQALKLKKENLQYLTEAYTVQRSLTHDFKNHIGTMTALLNQNKTEDLKAYLLRLDGKMLDCMFVVHTQNTIIDAVLNQKYKTAVSRNIAIDFNMTNLSELVLPSDEIAVILSNLLDNSIEACECCKDKKLIWIKTKISDGEVLLMITNTCEENPQTNKNQMQTTKKDFLSHGFGLRNVMSILNKYNAEYTIKHKDGLFTFVTFIPLVKPN